MKKVFFVVILAGTVVFAGVLAHLLRATPKTPQAYYESGKKLYDARKFAEATVEFQKAVQGDPNHRDSRYYLALSYLSEQNLNAGGRALQGLLEVHPDDVPASLMLGKIYLTGGTKDSTLFRDAQEIAQKVLTKDSQNLEALALSGNALAGLKDYDASVETLEKAASLDPKNTEALIALGHTRVLQKNFPEAEKAFLRARETKPKDVSTLLTLANFYRLISNAPKAEEVLKETLSEYPADKAVYGAAADFYINQKRYDDLEMVLRAAQAKNGNDPGPTLTLADAFQALNRNDDARKLLLDTKAKFPADIQLSMKLASNLLAGKPDFERARQEIDQILKADPKNPIGHVLLGELQFGSGQFDAAEATLGVEPVLSSKLPQVHFLLGELSLKKGKVKEAIDHYQKSLTLDGRYAPSRIALANQLMATGKLNDARGEISQLLGFDPNNPPGRLIEAMINAADKRYSDADAEFATLLKAFPDNPEILRQVGTYYASRGKNAEAEKSLSRALELGPNSEDAFQSLLTFYLQTKQLDRARQKLNGIPDTQKQPVHFELTGMVAEQAGQLQDAEIAYKKALEKDPNRMSSENLLFNLYLRTSRLDEAVKRLDGVAKKASYGGTVPAMKGAIFEMQGHSAEAEKSYRQALEADPANDLAANNLAYFLAQQGSDLQTALELAQGVRRRRPQDPEAADTLGWIYYKLDRVVLAKDQAQFAASTQPANAIFQYHLGEILKKNSQNAEALAALKKAAASKQEFKEKSLAEASLKDLLLHQQQPRSGKP